MIIIEYYNGVYTQKQMETMELVTIKIIDRVGNILHTQSLRSESGLAHLDIAATELHAGQYTCRIVRGNKEQNIQFIKH